MWVEYKYIFIEMEGKIMQSKKYFYVFILLILLSIEQSYCVHDQKGSLRNIEDGLATELTVNLIPNKIIYRLKTTPSKRLFCTCASLKNVINTRPYTKGLFFSPVVIKFTLRDEFIDLGIFNPERHQGLMNMIEKNRALYYQVGRGALIYSDYYRPIIEDFELINKIMKKKKHQL